MVDSSERGNSTRCGDEAASGEGMCLASLDYSTVQRCHYTEYSSPVISRPLSLFVRNSVRGTVHRRGVSCFYPVF